jgi:hypothetical protein
MWLLVVVVALSLLPFFHWFRGTPHQLAAIKELEESLPEELLDDDAAWFGAWKASGIDQEVYTPYFSQLDNASGQGYRECFSSAAAMVAATYRRVGTDDEYNQIRERFGPSTTVGAQIKTLKSLGLNVEFRIDGDAEMIEMEIEMGRPVLVGWLHKGDLSRGERPQCDSSDCGHWSLITGYKGKNSSDPRWVMQDPRGKPDLIQGGHSSHAGGKQVEVRQSEFSPRWEVDGVGTGWVILVDES